MGLFRDRSITEVAHHLDLVVPARRGQRGRVSNAAIVQARDQLCATPLAALFTHTATGVDHRGGGHRALARVSRLRPRRHHAAGARYPRECYDLRPPREPRRDGARAIRRCAWSRSSDCATLCWRPRPWAPLAPVNSRWPPGVGRAPRPRGGHPGPRLLQLRPVRCPARPESELLIATSSTARLRGSARDPSAPDRAPRRASLAARRGVRPGSAPSRPGSTPGPC
jgi:hypothetical protein